MNKFFQKIFGKKKQETVSDNLNQQNNISEQRINNQNPIQPDQPITFNQNMNIENQSVNPLGFQPTAPTDDIQNNQNAQPITFNQEPQQPSQQETLNVIPTLVPTPNPITPNQNNINNQNM